MLACPGRTGRRAAAPASRVVSSDASQQEETAMARVAIVTGGTRGIGKAISVGLRDAGYKVAANYGGNDEVARQFTAETKIPAFKFDVGDFAAVQAGVAKVVEALGPVD